jgi:hypothetical protein
MGMGWGRRTKDVVDGKSQDREAGSATPIASPKVGQRRFLQALGVVGLVALGEATRAPRGVEAAYQAGADQDLVTTNLSVEGNLVVGPTIGTPTAVLTVSQETKGATTVVGIANLPHLSVVGRAVPSVVGLYSRPEVRAESAITSLAGLVVDPSAVVQGQGEITNHFGIYVSGPTVGAQRWALYSASGANYFGGNVGIGVLNPEVALAVGSGPGLRVNGKGQVVAGGIVSSGPTILTSNDPNALAVGPQGATLPSLNVDASAPNAVTGLDVVANAAGSGLALALIGGNSNESLTLDAAGTGTLTLNGKATGGVVVGHGLTINGGPLGFTAPGGAAGANGLGGFLATGPGGAGNTNGGDLVINLGAGIGTGRNGQLQITSTDATVGTASDNAPLFVTENWNPAGPTTGSRQAAVLRLNVSGNGANISGSPSLAAIEIEHTSTLSGTVNQIVYGAETQMHLDGSGSYTGHVTGFQSNLRGVGTGGIAPNASGSGIRVAIGAFKANQGNLDGVLVYDLAYSGSEVHQGAIGFLSGITGVSASRSDSTPHTVRGAQLAIPSQGGNTSGTGYNIGLEASSLVSNAGGGTPGPGGTILNIGGDFYMPRANGGPVGSKQSNIGVRITEPTVGVAGGGSFLRWAIQSSATAPSMHAGSLAVGWTNTGADFGSAQRQLAAYLQVSGTTAISKYLAASYAQIAQAINTSGAINELDGFFVDAPLQYAASGPFQRVIGFRVAGDLGTDGRSTTRPQAAFGLAIEDQASATATSHSIYLGPIGGAPSSGAYSLYNNSANPSAFFQPLTITPRQTVPTGPTTVWNGVNVAPTTLTLTGSVRISTATGLNLVSIASPTLANASAATVDQAATLAIAGAPRPAGALTLTNAYAVWVQSGSTRFGGNVSFDPGANLVLDGATGTQIGTVGGASGQKLGFFGAAPVTQPVVATGSGLAVDDVIVALQNLGLFRQA